MFISSVTVCNKNPDISFEVAKKKEKRKKKPSAKYKMYKFTLFSQNLRHAKRKMIYGTF
jgi:hypothetical protein